MAEGVLAVRDGTDSCLMRMRLRRSYNRTRPNSRIMFFTANSYERSDSVQQIPTAQMNLLTTKSNVDPSDSARMLNMIRFALDSSEFALCAHMDVRRNMSQLIAPVLSESSCQMTARSLCLSSGASLTCVKTVSSVSGESPDMMCRKSCSGRLAAPENINNLLCNCF